MSIVGRWTIFYSWGCGGSYSQTTITFNNDGTFSTGDGLSGQWASLGGNVQWLFDLTPVVYSGNVSGGAMNGMMSVGFPLNFQGCWYATMPHIPAAFATEKRVGQPEQLDSAGGKKK